MSEHQEILDQLKSDDPDLIREGAFGAGEMAGEQGGEEFVPLLAEHLKSSNLGVQEAADSALRRIGGSVTVQAVSPLLRSEEAPVRNLSMDILREVGKEDFQALAELFSDKDPDIRIFISDILGSTDNVLAVDYLCKAMLRDPEVNVRYQAAVSLGELAFAEAAPCLNKAMKDEEWVQFAVIEALTKIRDESSVTALASALDSSTDLVASMIIDALGEMGNIKAISILLKRMDSSPTALRNIIVKALVKIMGGKSLNLLPEHDRENFGEYALAALSDEDEDIQDAAIQALGFVGGENATRAIIKLASGLDPVRDEERLEHISQCLASINFNDAFLEVIKGDDWKGGMFALRALTRKHEVSVVPALAECFWDKDRDMQREIIHSLCVLGDETHKDFFRDVLEKHNDGEILKCAVSSLGKKSPSQEDADRLFAFLEHPYDDVKEAALDACVAIGGPEVIDRFKQQFQSPEPISRLMATYALGKLGIRENLEEIRMALEDEIPDIRKVALKSLANLEFISEQDLAMVVPRLSDENKDVRLAVVEFLGEYPGALATKYLYQALNDEDDWVRIRAIEALGERREQKTIEQLIPLLETPNTMVALKVIEALGELGGKSSFRALLAVVNGDDFELQGAAEEAIIRIQETQGEGS